jgi:hypothetical protein
MTDSGRQLPPQCRTFAPDFPLPKAVAHHSFSRSGRSTMWSSSPGVSSCMSRMPGIIPSPDSDAGRRKRPRTCSQIDPCLLRRSVRRMPDESAGEARCPGFRTRQSYTNTSQARALPEWLFSSVGRCEPVKSARLRDRRRVYLEGHPSSLYREFRNIAEEHICEGYRDHAQSGDRGIHPGPSRGRDHIYLPIHPI